MIGLVAEPGAPWVAFREELSPEELASSSTRDGLLLAALTRSSLGLPRALPAASPTPSLGILILELREPT